MKQTIFLYLLVAHLIIFYDIEIYDDVWSILDFYFAYDINNSTINIYKMYI